MRDQANGRSRMVGFNNLASVVNGRQKMDVSLKPFDKRLTKESILGLKKKVGLFRIQECVTYKKCVMIGTATGECCSRGNQARRSMMTFWRCQR